MTERSAERSSLLSGGDRGGRLLLGSLVLAGASNLLFHSVMGRVLSPEQFGALGSVLAILTVALVPASALQMAVTSAVARRDRVGDPTAIRRRLFRTAAASTAVAVLAAPALADWLNLDSALPLVVAAFVLLPTAPLIIARGVLIGRLRYAPVAMATLVGNAVKLLGGIGLVVVGWGIEGAMLAVLAGESLMAIMLRRGLADNAEAPESLLRIRRPEAWRSITAYTGFWMLSSVGIVIARHHLPDVSGGFAAAWVIAGTILFLPAAFVAVVFPRMADEDERAARRVLVHSSGVSLALALAAAAGPIALPELALSIVAGPGYEEASSMVVVLSLAAIVTSLVNVVVHYHVARARPAANLAWVGVIVIGVGSAFANDSGIAVAWLSFVGAIAALAALSMAATRSPLMHLAKVGERIEIAGAPEVDITVVVPYFDPGPRVATVLAEIDSILSTTDLAYEIIPVSDGSTDGSDIAVAAMASPAIRPIVLHDNLGKGGAVRVGLSRGRGRYVGFIDGDGDIDPVVLREFAALVSVYEPDVVLGSKAHLMSRVEMTGSRRIASWGYRMLTRLLFKLEIRDTQTGVKLVRREVLADVLPHLLERRFTFDLELLVVARRFGHRAFFEAPISLRRREGSTIRIRDVFAMLGDTFTVFFRLHGSRRYDPVHNEADGRGTVAEARIGVAA